MFVLVLVCLVLVFVVFCFFQKTKDQRPKATTKTKTKTKTTVVVRYSTYVVAPGGVEVSVHAQHDGGEEELVELLEAAVQAAGWLVGFVLI